MWNNFTVDDDLYREIKEKGVVVYERESLHSYSDEEIVDNYKNLLE